MRFAIISAARTSKALFSNAAKQTITASSTKTINDIPAVFVPSEAADSTADDDIAAMDASTPKPSAQTVKIQIPPKHIPLSQLQSLSNENTAEYAKNSIKWEMYEGAPRVRPTKSGYIPPEDPAYAGWSTDEDKKLIHIMTNTPQGKGSDFRFVTQVYFPERRERDVRMRWNTYLKPQQYTRDKQARQVYAMRRKYGDDVTIVDGRWCVVPSGRVTPQPGESKLAYAGARQYNSGLSMLDIAVQRLAEAERARRYKISGDFQAKKEQRRRRQSGYILLENTEWIHEEDLVLRAAFEEFGPQWDRISRALKARFRTPEECRERFTQHMHTILAAGESLAHKDNSSDAAAI